MKDFALLNEGTDRKCEVTGGYNTNARYGRPMEEKLQLYMISDYFKSFRYFAKK